MSFFDDIGGALAQVTETVDSLAQTAGGVAGSLAKLKAAGQAINAKPGSLGSPIIYTGNQPVQGPPVAQDSTGLLLLAGGLLALLFLARS